jgi:diguanylate cyclase (GGDEF)-like protein/PAS domain S-box-containing protein
MFTLIAKVWMRDTFTALSELGIFQKSFVNAFNYPNTLWQQWGYPPEKMRGNSWLEAVHPEDRQMVARELSRQLAAGDTVELPEYRIITADGRVRWIYNRGRVVSRTPSGHVMHFIGHDLDITHRKEMEWMLELLREAGAIITSTLDSSEVIRRVLDQAGRFIPYDTAAVLLMTGEDTLKLVDGNGWEDPEEVRTLRIPIPGENPNTYVLERKEALIVENPAEHYADFNRLADNRVKSWMGIPLVIRGEAIGMVTFDCYSPEMFTATHRIFASMLGEHIAQALHNAQTFEHTHRQATRDPLTGALTRRALYAEGETLISETHRKGESVAVLMIDIDHFKNFNDTYGHAEGDEALTVLARTCRTRLRPHDLFGRYGGEEFVVILPRSSERAAAGAGERLRRGILDTPIGETGEHITISIGITVYDRKAAQKSFDDLLREADKALYEAKHRGRNRLISYSQIDSSSPATASASHTRPSEHQP